MYEAIAEKEGLKSIYEANVAWGQETRFNGVVFLGVEGCMAHGEKIKSKKEEKVYLLMIFNVF